MAAYRKPQRPPMLPPEAATIGLRLPGGIGPQIPMLPPGGLPTMPMRRPPGLPPQGRMPQRGVRVAQAETPTATDAPFAFEGAGMQNQALSEMIRRGMISEEDALRQAAGGALPGEIAGRAGMAMQFLDQYDDLRKSLASGAVTGPVDYTWGAIMGRGESGETQRRVAAGVEALIRNMTGAQMPASEAAQYAWRYRPNFRDDAATAVRKLDGLKRDLEWTTRALVAGRGLRLEDMPGMEGERPAARQAAPDAPADDAPPAPEGVDPNLWKFMTPEERALWQN